MFTHLFQKVGNSHDNDRSERGEAIKSRQRIINLLCNLAYTTNSYFFFASKLINKLGAYYFFEICTGNSQHGQFLFPVGQEKNLPCVVSTLKIMASNMNPKTLSSPLMALVATRNGHPGRQPRTQLASYTCTLVGTLEILTTISAKKAKMQHACLSWTSTSTSYLTSMLLFLVYTIPFCNPRTSTACPLPFSTLM